LTLTLPLAHELQLVAVNSRAPEAERSIASGPVEDDRLPGQALPRVNPGCEQPGLPTRQFSAPKLSTASQYPIPRLGKNLAIE